MMCFYCHFSTGFDFSSPSSFSVTKFLLFERFIKTAVSPFFQDVFMFPDLSELHHAPWDDSHLTSFPNRRFPLSLPPV